MSPHPALVELLRRSSLHAMLLLSAKALSRSGFGDVELLDRRHRRQKSRVGGCELLCRTQLGTMALTVIVKVVRDSVRTRMLDEMAGAIDRTKADLGLLISTEAAPRRLARLQANYDKARVELMDVHELARLLTNLKVGVRSSGEPDFALFLELEQQLDRVHGFLAFERLAR